MVSGYALHYDYLKDNIISASHQQPVSLAFSKKGLQKENWDSGPTYKQSGLCRLAAWHLPGGPVGPPARWTATLNVKGRSGTAGGD